MGLVTPKFFGDLRPRSLIQFCTNVENLILGDSFRNEVSSAVEALVLCSNRKGKIIFVGDGLYSQVASHCATDFTKLGGIRSLCFSDNNLYTCLNNDFGDEDWLEVALGYYADIDDLVVFLSPADNEIKILKGIDFCQKKKINFLICDQVGSFNLCEPRNKFLGVAVKSMLYLAALDLFVGVDF